MRQRVLSLYVLLAYTTILAAMLSFVQGHVGPLEHSI